MVFREYVKRKKEQQENLFKQGIMPRYNNFTWFTNRVIGDLGRQIELLKTIASTEKSLVTEDEIKIKLIAENKDLYERCCMYSPGCTLPNYSIYNDLKRLYYMGYLAELTGESYLTKKLYKLTEKGKRRANRWNIPTVVDILNNISKRIMFSARRRTYSTYIYKFEI